MIISIHIPKTAGGSFLTLLKKHYGKHVLTDYQEMPDEFGYTLKDSFTKIPSSLSNIKIIHGHFTSEKYEYIPNGQFIVWLRDPVQRILSHYYYWKNYPSPLNSTYNFMKNNNLSVLEFAKLDPIRNLQKKFLSKKNLNDFAFVGITENFAKSITHFNRVFSANLTDDIRVHENPLSKANDVEASILQKIRDLNLEDMALYEQALNLTSRYT